jgi:hypothetical protein
MSGATPLLLHAFMAWRGKNFNIYLFKAAMQQKEEKKA